MCMNLHARFDNGLCLWTLLGKEWTREMLACRTVACGCTEVWKMHWLLGSLYPCLLIPSYP